MQKVLTAAEMREVDRLTTEKYGIPSIILMENAAHAVARVITERLGASVKGKSILILCGKGNNGGDGAALARLLWQQGADVYVCLLSKLSDAACEARQNLDIVQHLSNIEIEIGDAEVFFNEILSSGDWESFLKRHFDYDDPDLIVDALFGTGLTKPLSEHFEKVARWVRGENIAGVEQDSLVCSIDIPSGLDADRPEWIGQSLRANWTVTFTAPKLSNVLPPVLDFNGEVIIANIGSPRNLIDSQPSQLYLAEKSDARQWLQKSQFSENSYKNKRGHALLIAGSEDYSGAAVLAGNAAMRSGVGLVTVAAPKECKAEIAARLLPDVILKGIDGESAEQ
jgi:NAD(P)H-hydrate epimerase